MKSKKLLALVITAAMLFTHIVISPFSAYAANVVADALPDIDLNITMDDVYNTVSGENGGYVNSWTQGKSEKLSFDGTMLQFTSLANTEDLVATYTLVKESDDNVYLEMTGYNHQLRANTDNPDTSDTDFYGKKMTLGFRVKVNDLKANLLIQPYMLTAADASTAMNINMTSGKKISFNAAYGVSDEQNNQTYAYDAWYDVTIEMDFADGDLTFTAINESTNDIITAVGDISAYKALGSVRFQNQAKETGGTICLDDISVSQEEAVTKKFSYNVDSNNNATITGYTKNLTDAELQNLVIPEKLEDKYTVVEVGGFGENTRIQTVTLPPTLKRLSNDAFYKCTALTSVTMPSVETIGSRAFYGCSKLSCINSDYAGEVVLPKNLTTLGANAFRTSNLIKTVILPSSLEKMSGVFGNTMGVKNIYFPDTITSEVYNEDFAGTGFSSAIFTTINAYGSADSYIKTYAETAVESVTGNKIYNFVEENSSLLVMDGEFTDGFGIALRGTKKDADNGSKAVGFNARLFNVGETPINSTAIIAVTSSLNELKSIDTATVSVPSWQGVNISFEDLIADNVTLEDGDKIKVMFWENIDTITPIVTQKLEYIIDLTTDEILVMAIGNSYSQDSISYLNEIAAADGIKLSAYTCYVGGRPLIEHYDALINSEDEANENRIYTMRSGDENFIELTSAEMLSMYDWDVVTLQAATHPTHYDQIFWEDSYSYDDYGEGTSEDILITFNESVSELAPNAERMFIAPWAPYEELASSSYSGKFADGSPDSRGAFTSELIKRSEIAADIYATDGLYIPTAVAVDYLIRHYGFDEVQGTLTSNNTYDNNSGTTSVYRDTTCHLTNNVGRVLAGLVWYEMITGNSAADNKYTNSIDSELMTQIKEAAHYACQNYKTYNPDSVTSA